MAVFGSRAMESHESCQVREEAAVSGPFYVPRCILKAVINESCKVFFYVIFGIINLYIFLLKVVIPCPRRVQWLTYHYTENGAQALLKK